MSSIIAKSIPLRRINSIVLLNLSPVINNRMSTFPNHFKNMISQKHLINSRFCVKRFLIFNHLPFQFFFLQTKILIISLRERSTAAHVYLQNLPSRRTHPGSYALKKKNNTSVGRVGRERVGRRRRRTVVFQFLCQKRLKRFLT